MKGFKKLKVQRRK